MAGAPSHCSDGAVKSWFGRRSSCRPKTASDSSPSATDGAAATGAPQQSRGGADCAAEVAAATAAAAAASSSRLHPSAAPACSAAPAAASAAPSRPWWAALAPTASAPPPPPLELATCTPCDDADDATAHLLDNADSPQDKTLSVDLFDEESTDKFFEELAAYLADTAEEDADNGKEGCWIPPQSILLSQANYFFLPLARRCSPRPLSCAKPLAPLTPCASAPLH